MCVNLRVCACICVYLQACEWFCARVYAFASVHECTRIRCAYVCMCWRVNACVRLFFRECATITGFRQLGKNETSKNHLFNKHSQFFSVHKLPNEIFLLIT